MMKQFRYFFLLILLLSTTGLLAGCNKEGESNLPEPEASTTETVLVPMVSDIVVEGEVIAGDFVNLSFDTGGILDEVLVEEGNPVEKGQVIATLKGREQYEAQVAAIELSLLSAQQSLDDLLETADISLADANLSLAKAEKAYQDALDDSEDVSKTRGSVDLIELAYAEYILTQNKVDEAERAFAGVQNLEEEDEDRAEVTADLASAREIRDAALAKWNYLKSKPDDFETAEIESSLELAKANLEDAQRYWGELVDGIDPDELAIREARVNELQIRLDAMNKQMEYLNLISPIEGMLVINDLEKGELIAPGISYATVADDSSWLVETTDLTELEITDIKENMPVRVTFDALPDVELIGKVDRIKEIGVSKQGDITYTVVIDLDEWDDRLLWKMTASVLIER